MRQHANDIEAANLNYNPFAQNSNSTVASVLNVIGIDLPASLPRATGVLFSYPARDNLLEFGYSLNGTAANDILRDSGGLGNDTFKGFGGDDAFYLSKGNDSVDGGLGTDSVILRNASRADSTVVGSGASRTVTQFDGSVKTLNNVEKVLFGGTSHITSNALLGFGSNVLFKNDDQSSSLINLDSIFEEGLQFNGNTYQGIYVNTNGNITFDGPLSTFTPNQIGNGSFNIIAPFWADVDTRNPSSPPGTNGDVYWDFNASRDSFVITWSNVGYFDEKIDKRDTFQLELVDQGGGGFEIIFRYLAIDWTTGDASGGSDGLGGTVARAGFSLGGGLVRELPGSGSQSAMLDLDSTKGNTGVAGVWQFNVLAGELQNVGTETADVFNGGSGDDFYLGGGGNDRLAGNAGNDRLYGGQGNDTLIAGSGQGNDHYDGGAGIDLIGFSSASLRVIVNLGLGLSRGARSDSILDVEQVHGGRGNDAITGNAFANLLLGNDGNDVLNGLAGNDRLQGDAGRDVLNGGAGRDIFKYDFISDTGRTFATRDTILDFRHLTDDIDLRLIDANTALAGNQAFSFVGSAPFTGARGQLHYQKFNPPGAAGDATIVSGDVNGDKIADFSIQLKGLITLSAGDFIL